MKIIFPITLLIIAGVLSFLFAKPLYGDVKQLKSEVSTYSLAIDNSNELQKTRDSLIDKYKNIRKEDKDRLNHFLPDTIGNIELILEIEKIANLHGMPIRNIKFESMSADGKDKKVAEGSAIVAEGSPENYLPYGVFPMEFVVEGNYNAFLAFLDDLEHNLRLIDIKGVGFSVPIISATATENPINPNIYSYSFKIEAYWLK